MTRPISNRTREQAIRCCQLVASNFEQEVDYPYGPALNLAADATCFVQDALRLPECDASTWAEAECLLREGWLP